MKIKSLISTCAAAGLMSLASLPAHALIAYDAWQVDLNGSGISSLTTNIGHLSLSGGGASVTQQVDLSGNVFVGAKFVEFGTVQSLVFAPNNVVGTGDSGTALLNGLSTAFNGLEFVFSGLSGVVSSIGTGFNYVFDAGVGSITLRALKLDSTTVNLATFQVVQPSNGSFANNLGAAGVVGDSTILGLVSILSPNLFRNSAGVSLDPLALANELFLNVLTHNTIADGGVGAAGLCDTGFAPAPGEQAAVCVNVNVTSDGAADLFRVPEPDSIALLGIGLLGLVSGLRRRKAKVVS